MSPEFRPVTVYDVLLLDPDEVARGYQCGASGEPEPIASYYSRSFWHGWRTGAADGGHVPLDQHHTALSVAYTLGVAAGCHPSLQ
jgi:ribosome modulation factor